MMNEQQIRQLLDEYKKTLDPEIRQQVQTTLLPKMRRWVNGQIRKSLILQTRNYRAKNEVFHPKPINNVQRLLICFDAFDIALEKWEIGHRWKPYFHLWKCAGWALGNHFRAERKAKKVGDVYSLGDELCSLQDIKSESASGKIFHLEERVDIVPEASWEESWATWKEHAFKYGSPTGSRLWGILRGKIKSKDVDEELKGCSGRKQMKDNTYKIIREDILHGKKKR